MANENMILIGGRLHSIATGNVVAGANEIWDDELNMRQSDINKLHSKVEGEVLKLVK
jgi:hypothetical protein